MNETSNILLYLSGNSLVFEDVMKNLCVTKARLELNLKRNSVNLVNTSQWPCKTKMIPLIYIFRKLITQTLVDHAQRNFSLEVFISNDLSTLYDDESNLNVHRQNPKTPSAETDRNGRSLKQGDPLHNLQRNSVPSKSCPF